MLDRIVDVMTEGKAFKAFTAAVGDGIVNPRCCECGMPKRGSTR